MERPIAPLPRCFLSLVLLLMAACAETPHSTLPPSATDLVLLAPDQLCSEKGAFRDARQADAFQTLPWGLGEELRMSPAGPSSSRDQSYYFDQEGQLVGAVFAFPGNGLALKPYPVLRDTLSQLRPDMEFYLPGASVDTDDTMSSGVLYRTGDEHSTMSYVVSGEGRSAILRIAAVVIDPYERLLSPYRPEFVARLGRPAEGALGQVGGSPDQGAFEALQQFARGETAMLGYCGTRDYDRAADAYQKALAVGLPDKMRIAEAHHRLGLAYQGQGLLQEARDQMERSLEIHPNTPEVLNNVATVYSKLGDRDKAIKILERAVTLRPNYALARYNLAEAYESLNVKRAIAEYETYLALVQGIPEEEDRAVTARERVKVLRRR